MAGGLGPLFKLFLDVWVGVLIFCSNFFGANFLMEIFSYLANPVYTNKDKGQSSERHAAITAMRRSLPPLVLYPGEVGGL